MKLAKIGNQNKLKSSKALTKVKDFVHPVYNTETVLDISFDSTLNMPEIFFALVLTV